MRVDPKPDPFAKNPTALVRNPGKAESKTVVVDSTRPAPRMRAHVHHLTATQSINNNVATDVIWNAIDFDTVGLLIANQFVLPAIGIGKVTSSWWIHVHVTWEAAVAGGRELDILANGTVISSTHILGSNDQMSQDATILVNDPLPATAYKVQVKQTSGGPLNLITEPEHSYFEIIHLW